MFLRIANNEVQKKSYFTMFILALSFSLLFMLFYERKKKIFVYTF